jgi:Protein of unknown function (DUF3147)
MRDLLLRFVIGGFVVSFFAILGDVLRPKSFAGLFGAAPSLALATLGLSIYQHGKGYTAHEARSMMLGATAFLVYAALTSWILRRYRRGALATTLALMPVWLVLSLGLCALLYGGM